MPCLKWWEFIINELSGITGLKNNENGIDKTEASWLKLEMICDARCSMIKELHAVSE